MKEKVREIAQAVKELFKEHTAGMVIVLAAAFLFGCSCGSCSACVLCTPTTTETETVSESDRAMPSQSDAPEETTTTASTTTTTTTTTTTLSAAGYKALCKDYTYNEIARNPDNYFGQYAHFRGEVIQVLLEDGSYTLRVNITKGDYFWEDTILVVYEPEAGADRILEEDIVDLYGMMAGEYTYETVFGSSETVPLMLAEYVEM